MKKFSKLVEEIIEISCGILMISPDNKVFLIKPFGNKEYWHIPKGHKNKNESDEETAKREFYEETGIKSPKQIEFLHEVVKGVKLVKIFKTLGTGKEIFNPPKEFYMDYKGKKVPEAVKGKWFEIDEALEKIIPYQKIIIEKL